MKPKINQFFIPTALLATVVIVAFNAWIAFRSLGILLEQESWVRHTWQVINQVESSIGSVREAESDSRGYVLTGNEDYLPAYTEALQNLPLEISNLKSLTSDNPLEQARIVEFEAIAEQRISLLQQEVILRRNNRAAGLHALIVNGTGRVQMQHLQAIADSLDQEEQHLLSLRSAQALKSKRNTQEALAVASVIDFLLIILMFRYFSIERRMRISSQETAKKLAVAQAETEAKAAEISGLNRTLEERVRLRTAELETANHELEAFSYSVSHDLRAPLRTIDGFSLALEEDYASLVGETGKDYIRRVRNGVQRMGELIDALLQLSRITRASIVREKFSLSELVSKIATDLKEQHPGRSISFQVEAGLMAEGDSKLITVALENLLGNAVKFSAKASQASIAFGWDLEKSAWFVRDNGAGFDMQYAGKLFNAFNRLHGDKDFKGSGIGLATVARVIHRHHGEIWADSVVNHGATFWFTLG